MKKDLKLRTTFDQVAEIYDQARPSYPDELFIALIKKTGINENSKLLEIACGTGQATLPLAKRGFHITAIELGEHLAEIARQNLKDYPNVEVIIGAFEDVELPADSFDLVYVATAFHWIKPESKFTKPHKLLKPNGYLAVWSGGQASDEKGDLFTNATQPFYHKYFADDKNTPFHLKSISELEPAELDKKLFEQVYFKCFPRPITYTANEYIQLLNTDSEKIALPNAERMEFLAEIKNLINNKFNGKVIRYYANPLTIAKKI